MKHGWQIGVLDPGLGAPAPHGTRNLPARLMSFALLSHVIW